MSRLLWTLSFSSARHFVLVLVDYAMQYPEAVPQHTISAKSMVQAMFQVISLVAILKEILTDQGMSSRYVTYT